MPRTMARRLREEKLDETPRLNRPLRPEELWDQFIDALDRAGQAGGAHGVRVPELATGALAGRAFGDLTRDDVQQLARIGAAFGRRGETVVTLWQDTQRRLRGPLKGPRKHQRRG